MRRLFIGFLLLMFALRALAPAHAFAMGPVSGSGTEVVICTSAGTKTLVLGADGQSTSSLPTDPKAAEGECPFCPVHAKILASAASLAVSAAVHYAAVTFVQAVAVSRAMPRPRGHSARGPPSFRA